MRICLKILKISRTTHFQEGLLDKALKPPQRLDEGKGWMPIRSEDTMDKLQLPCPSINQIIRAFPPFITILRLYRVRVWCSG